MENSEAVKHSKKTKMIVIVTLITLVIIGVIIFVAFKYKKQIVVSQDNNLVIAKVNGSEITKKEFSLAMSGIVNSIDFNRVDTTKSTAQEDVMVETLNTLIDNELILQQAKTMKLSVTQNEIDNELIKIKSGFNSYDEYLASLSKTGVTEDELRSDIEKQLLMQQYETRVINPNVDTVSEEDINAFYKKLSDRYIAQGSIAPDLELVRNEIVKKLVEIKHDLVLQTEAKKLRKSAKVEVYI